MLALALAAGGCHRTAAAPSRAPVVVPVPSLPVPPVPAAQDEPLATRADAGTAPAARAEPQVFDIRSASGNYDFRLTVPGDAEPQDEYARCQGPAELTLWRKGSVAPLQSLELDAMCIVQGAAGHVLVNSARMVDDQGTIQVGDFNFDGHEDFAVQDSESGAYGGPTYAVYLYSPREGLFVHSEDLSQLTQATLGMFHVDARRRRIVTSSKSGCCFHATEEFEVVGDKPALRTRHTEALEAAGDRLLITDERFVKGAWRVTSRSVPVDP